MSRFFINPFISLNRRNYPKKEIDNSIDISRGWGEKMVSIFRLGCCVEVGLRSALNGAVSEIYT